MSEDYDERNFLVDATNEAKSKRILEMADQVIRLLAGGHEPLLIKWIQAQIEEAVAAEREACAKVADKMAAEFQERADAWVKEFNPSAAMMLPFGYSKTTAEQVAIAIRKRGGQ